MTNEIARQKEAELEALLGRLSLNQLRFVAARVAVKTDAEAAHNAGLGISTVYNWPNRDDVMEAVRLVTADFIVDMARAALQQMAFEAAETIYEIMKKGERHRDRLSAANDALDRGGVPRLKDVHKTVDGTVVAVSLEDIMAARERARVVEANIRELTEDDNSEEE